MKKTKVAESVFSFQFCDVAKSDHPQADLAKFGY
jgi:hypothetical protein